MRKSFTLVASLVQSQDVPTPHYSTKKWAIASVTKQELDDIVSALDGAEIEVDASATELDTAICERAQEILEESVPDTSVDDVFIVPSRPVGGDWMTIKGSKYLHCKDVDESLIVAFDGDKKKNVTWWQLCVEAQEPAEELVTLEVAKVGAKRARNAGVKRGSKSRAPKASKPAGRRRATTTQPDA